MGMRKPYLSALEGFKAGNWVWLPANVTRSNLIVMSDGQLNLSAKLDHVTSMVGR